MKTPAHRRLRLALLALAVTLPLNAAEPDAATAARRDLLDLLERKGVLTAEEAAGLATPAPPPAVFPLGKNVSKLSIGGRIQVQFASLSGEVDSADDPATQTHFLLRRVYLSTRAELGPDWRVNVTYNFANSLFDVAAVQWLRPDYSVDIGYRPVNFGREQRISSGALKAIERSTATRYFVESNNGNRLGAGNYHVGVFAEGKTERAYWSAAVTNPEQPATLAAAAATGSGANNRLAAWIEGGLLRSTDRSSLRLGTGAGWLPEQGGRTPGTGEDLFVGNVHLDYAAGAFALLAEVFGSHHPGGAVDGSDTRALGAFVQPSWRFDKRFEGVFRIGYLDTDGRGMRMADGIPGAPVLPATDRLWDGYLGATWYIQGNDLKFQAGLIYARGEDAPDGSEAETETVGLRSQFQVNF
ncbi:MAG: OprO/OprP family phosphate-selective porin [Opitutaceae bacterium]|jgi:hypothetical protein|nr:OprO/OprP family phosphate-selective porin [Opitutaceae bacterium]